MELWKPETGDSGAPRLDEVIERQQVSARQARTLAICVIVTILDGFDAQSIGFLASPLADHFHADVRSFGSIFALGLVGIMVGALAVGPLGDRFGRKRALVASLVTIGAFSLLTVFARSLDELAMLRLLTGLGLGGAIPNAIAMLTEYTPTRLRRLAICVASASIPAGGMLAGLLASAMLPGWGWQSMFVAGGVAPLLLAAVVATTLPESLRYLSLRNTDQDRVLALLNYVWPEARVRQISLSVERKAAKLPVRELFREGRTVITLAIWTAYFMNLLVLYVVVSWLPAMLRTAGLPISTGIMAITTFSFGGILGSLVQAPLMAWCNPPLVMMTEFAIVVVLVESLAFATLTPLSVGVVAFAIGVVIQGAQAGLNVFAATFYPTAVRATGVGWGLGIGRIGSICGPLLAGAALMSGWTANNILSVGAVPAVVAAGAIMLAAARGLTADAGADVSATRRRPGRGE